MNGPQLLWFLQKPVGLPLVLKYPRYLLQTCVKHVPSLLHLNATYKCTRGQILILTNFDVHLLTRQKLHTHIAVRMKNPILTSRWDQKLSIQSKILLTNHLFHSHVSRHDWLDLLFLVMPKNRYIFCLPPKTFVSLQCFSKPLFFLRTRKLIIQTTKTIAITIFLFLHIFFTLNLSNPK